MKRLWVVNVTIPNLTLSPEYFSADEKPSEEQVCAALGMRPRVPGDPDAKHLSRGERMSRLYPRVQIEEITFREL